jgi:hypothetical protein
MGGCKSPVLYKWVDASLLSSSCVRLGGEMQHKPPESQHHMERVFELFKVNCRLFFRSQVSNIHERDVKVSSYEAKCPGERNNM